VDAILVETMNTVREARIALAAALATGRPALVSFVCSPEARLLSGETLASAVDAVAPLGPLAVLVNCLPPRAVEANLPVLAASGLPFGAYANLGRPDAQGGFARSDDCLPEELAAFASSWVARGARLVGGCCGTTPEHVRALAAAVRRKARPEHEAAIG
jgi:S-methylmethionine-dependent homocysteine/selenocysteine methylase